MRHGNEQRFQDFFVQPRYVALKNHLYNYRLRKRAIEKALAKESHALVLEIGSGLSPVMTRTDRIVYSELSFRGLRHLKRTHGRGWYVVADATRLPFSDGAFSHTVCSEVLEHIEDDEAALGEMARVMVPGGRMLVTFPHRRIYYWNDDRYVRHFRRYEIGDMAGKLERAGLRILETRKVLGPLDKLTMSAVVFGLEAIALFHAPQPAGGEPGRLVRALEPPFRWFNYLYTRLAQLDAAVMPRAVAAILLVRAEKRAR
jgi:SAM-dependent methyltransferase